MKKVVVELQSRLHSGERVACYVSKNSLVDIEPGFFLNEQATSSISCGRFFPPGWSPTAGDTQMFIRSAEYEAPVAITCEDLEVGQPPGNTKLGGRPNTTNSAVAAYWAAFPKGHESEKNTY